jgi:hypothetical protein
MPPADVHTDLGNSFSAGSLRAEPPVPAPAFDPASLFGGTPAPQPHSLAPAPAPVAVPPAVAPAPVAVPVPARPAAVAAVNEDFSFGAAEDLVQLALRALFLTADPLTPASIAEKCAAFPGLRACLVLQTDGTRHSGSSQTGSDVAHFHDTAHRSAESLRMLAESLGQEPRGTFTLRSGGGLRTILLERTVSLAVLHDGTEFHPGVREKLALTVRALADMRA